MVNKNRLKILFVSVEVSPYAKTGGLADVAGSLPKALIQMGHDVRVAMPRFKSIKADMDYVTDFPINMMTRLETCIIRKNRLQPPDIEVPVYFIDNYYYYRREGIYGYYDDGERFAFFCRAVIEMLPFIDFKPDIIHCNDWHTGPISMVLKENYKNHKFYQDIKTVFTIHNLQYQGHFDKELLRAFDLGMEHFTTEKVEFYGVFNFMKAGLVYADKINTVSKNYAKEILTTNFGERLDGVLMSRKNDLYGILNGISLTEWNPANNPNLVQVYDKNSIEMKSINKKALQKELGLQISDHALAGIVSRLAGQKGFDLIVEKFDCIMERNIQLVILGVGEEGFEIKFKELAEKYKGKFVFKNEFNTSLAHRIYAASDIFLMPSVFEPCGLGQMISLRYGAVPVVRDTGGLSDTVLDYSMDKEKSNGFIFKNYNSDELLKTIDLALSVFQNKNEWKKLILKGMSADFSWSRSALEYQDLYFKTL